MRWNGWVELCNVAGGTDRMSRQYLFIIPHVACTWNKETRYETKNKKKTNETKRRASQEEEEEEEEGEEEEERPRSRGGEE